MDITGLRERIETAYEEQPLWKELSLAQKVRFLLQTLLDQIEKEKKEKNL